MGSFRRIIRGNSAGLRVTATALTFKPQNKQKSHHTQTNDVRELHSVWPERRMILPHRSYGGFPKNIEISVWFKMFTRTHNSNVPLSPNPEWNWWIQYWTSKPISVKHILMWIFSFCLRLQSNLYFKTNVCIAHLPYVRSANCRPWYKDKPASVCAIKANSVLNWEKWSSARSDPLSFGQTAPSTHWRGWVPESFSILQRSKNFLLLMAIGSLYIHKNIW